MNEKKKSYISWNINSKYYIYSFLLPISCMFTHFFQNIMLENSLPEKSYKILKYNFPFLFYYFLHKLLSFIIIHIIKYNTKGENTKGKNVLSRRYHFLIKNEKIKEIFIIIYIISFLEVLFKVGDSVLIYCQKIGKIHNLIEKRTGFIICVPLFSYLILYKKLYKHHIIALVFALIGAFIVNFIRFVLEISFIDEFLYHLLILIFSFVFYLSLVIIKYLLTKYLISPYIFLFYDGIFCLINSLIFILLEYPVVVNIFDSKLNVKMNVEEENDKYFQNNFFDIFIIFIGQNWKFYLGFFMSFIFSFCYFVFNILTIYHFSPYLNVLTDFLTPFLYNIVDYIFSNNKENIRKLYLYEFIGYIIIIFGAIILNEIIVFNFWGLNQNTYKIISDRGDLDFTIGLNNTTPDESVIENNTEIETSSEKSKSNKS